MRHVYECPMRWADLDQLGHVNNVVYADYLQEARIDLLRTVLPSWRTDLAAGVEAAVVVRHEVTYRSPLEFDGGPVSVEVWVTEVRAATFTLAYEIFHEAADGARRVYAGARSVLTPYVFAEERPRRIRPEEATALAAYAEPAAPRAEPPAPVPAVVVDGAHVWPLRVRFSDVDLFRHVNNVRYFEYLQEARIAMLDDLARAAGVSGRRLVVAQTDVDYRAPVLLRPEPYAVRSRPTRVGTRSTTVDSEIVDGTRVLARARVVLVFWDPATGRSTEPHPALREQLVAMLPDTAR